MHFPNTAAYDTLGDSPRYVRVQIDATDDAPDEGPPQRFVSG